MHKNSLKKHFEISKKKTVDFTSSSHGEGSRDDLKYQTPHVN